MEGTPGLDIDMPHTPTGAMHFPPSGPTPASAVHPSNPQGTEQANGAPGPSQPTPSGHKFSNGPHIRSRITVVCAECKRLKLKCDRRTPCSSCLKRDTVQRCVYSQAAAEKVDVQTLHNRIIEIERVLAQLQTVSPSASVSSVLAGLSPFKQPATAVPGPTRIGPATVPSASTLFAGLPCNDRALLAQGASGSSVVINLEDVVSLWLNELDDLALDSNPRTPVPDPTPPIRPSSSAPTVKLEPAPVSIPPAPSASFSPGNASHIPIGGFSTLHPPAPYDSFLPPPSAGPSALPQVTAALISYLPAEPARSRYLKAFRETMLLHPSFNVPHFEQRIAAIFTWAENGASVSSAAPAYGKPPMSKQDLARDIFFSAAKPGTTSRTTPGGGPPNSGFNCNTPKPTLSFFSAACSAFALGSLVSRDEDTSNPTSPLPSSPGSTGETSGTSAMLFALSEQALQLFEKTATYDLDSVIAMILQVLYMLHEGGMSVAQSVFPLVGKMVNVARMMGLAMDPDEFPGTYNLFEAETRRRVWWEVYYYDLFVADAMGHPPLIADNTHTTRLPADVEEDMFTPSCTSFPVPESAQGDSSSVYFGLKCRLAQLVKNIKKQTFRDPLGVSDEATAELSIDHAGTFEGDISSFLQDLPPGFKLETTQDISKPIPPLPPSGATSPIRIAQKCELAILANRLIVKLYLPFLKEAAAMNKPAHQAVFGTISAAHKIIHASRMLHSVWGQTRPAVFDFYDFGRTLFDAAVVCAHAVIQDPTSIVASEGMKSVSCALEILQELGSSRLGVEGTRADNHGSNRSEAVKIVDLMKRKAEAARSGGGNTAGTKRKHSEVEGETLASSSLTASFQLPFVGAAVSSSKAERPRAPAAQRAGTTAANGKDDAKGKPDAKRQAKDKDKKEDKDKPAKYLNGPLRMRPMTGQPGPRRQRTASVSTAAASTPAPTAPPPAATSSRARGPPSTPSPPSGDVLPPSSSSQLPPSVSRGSVPIPESSMAASAPYEGYSSISATAQDQSMQQREQQHDDYVMQYSSPDDSISDERRYSAAQSSYDSPQSAGTAYEPQPQPQYVQSPVSAYPPTPSQPQNGYYLSYPPQPPPGPPTNGYEGHAAMMGMMGPPPPPPPPQTDTPGTGGIAPSLTTISHTYVPPRQIEYQTQPPPPQSHQHQHQHQHLQHQQAAMQGWPPQSSPPGAEMWPKYEYGQAWAT